MSKKMLYLNSFMALAAMSAMSHNHHRVVFEDNLAPKPTKEQIEEFEKSRKKAKQKAIEEKINKSNGLTEFFYGENSLWALNQKSADKKAIKKGWI